MSNSDERREVWLCRTCAWGFPESLGYSCSRLDGHVCSHAVVACEEYRRRHGAHAPRGVGRLARGADHDAG